MDSFDEPHLDMLAAEAFIRRAAELGQPFMLKGSYVTRQYFADPLDREPQDLDWVYTGGHIAGEAAARALFNEWVTRVTELPAPDGVVFESFQKNAFWRGIDYAMADDFPTVNTDLTCRMYRADGSRSREVGLGLDVSFNLPVDVPGEPLYYTPLVGEPFIVAHSTPLGSAQHSARPASGLEAAPNAGAPPLQRPLRPTCYTCCGTRASRPRCASRPWKPCTRNAAPTAPTPPA